MITDKDLIDVVRFVATKFSNNTKPWVYSRNVEGLKHIRFESDYTGYNHWTKRLKRALDLRDIFMTRNSFSRRMGIRSERRSLKMFFIEAWAHIYVFLRKDTNLPDGQVNGNFTFWEEDGEYISMMCPTVGVKVLDFLEAEPDNEHAKAILAAMHEAYEASWGSED